MLFLNKMREIRLTKSWLVDKALIAEGTEILRLVNSVLYDEPRHRSPGRSFLNISSKFSILLPQIIKYINSPSLVSDIKGRNIFFHSCNATGFIVP